MRTDQKQTHRQRCLTCLSFPCGFPAKALGREKTFPAVVRKSVRKALILWDSVSNIEKISLVFGVGREVAALSGRAKAGDGCPDLVSPPRLRYISPSVGGV